jgi:uncharacterized protein
MTRVSVVEERPTEREPLSDLLIVDLDVHVHEHPRALVPYIDMPWRVALENIQDMPETPMHYVDTPGFSPGTAVFEAPFPTGHEATRRVRDAAQMREELDAIHVDLAVLFPDHLLKLPVLTQHDYAAALARAYNAWLVDQWASHERGLLGAIAACPQDPEDAAREIRKYGSHPDVVSVFLPCAGVDPLYGDRKYDPIWEAVTETGLAVLLHSVGITHPVFPFQNHGFHTEMGRHALSHTFSIMANVTHMLTAGVMSRFPDVRMCVVEVGIEWLPFIMHRLDKEYIERRGEVPFLERRPSEYIKEIWVATQPIEEPEDLTDVARIVDLYDGIDNTVFASDWPHHDFDHPMKLDQVPLTSDARRKIFGTNALELLQIDSTGRRLTT